MAPAKHAERSKGKGSTAAAAASRVSLKQIYYFMQMNIPLVHNSNQMKFQFPSLNVRIVYANGRRITAFPNAIP